MDSLLPDGVTVPSSFLITTEAGVGSDIISTAIIQEHLSSSPSVPFEEQKILWLSLDNFVEDLRDSIDFVWLGDAYRIQFIDCYSSQIGIDSQERFHADPSNLPYLSMVTSRAISELNNGGRLLVFLDSLTSLIQKVGDRRSLEFFRTLAGKTRSISADLLTTLNRRVFSEATLATFLDVADLVIDLAVEDNESSAGKLRVRKARKVRHLLGWRNYKIDLERRTFHYQSVPSTASDEVSDAFELSPGNDGHGIDDMAGESLTNDRSRFNEPKGLSVSCEGPYCTFGGRAIMERERLAIFAEIMSTFARKYSDDLQVIARAIEKRQKKQASTDSTETLRDIGERVEKMDKICKLILEENRIQPNVCNASLDEVIQKALAASLIPTNVRVVREPNGSITLPMDASLVTRALAGVMEAAMDEMPDGGSVSIKDRREGDMAIIEVRNTGPGNWSDDLFPIFEPRNGWNPSGLGLLVARKFVEVHGGQLRIGGERGKGTTFTLRLPMTSS